MKQPQNKNNSLILINKPFYGQKTLIKTKVYCNFLFLLIISVFVYLNNIVTHVDIKEIY